MVDLATDWLGLQLRSPLVVGASPLADTVAAAQRLVATGAGAVVVHSLFEEQIVNDQLAAHRYFDTHVDTDAEARSFLADTDVFAVGATPTLRHVEALRAALDVPVLASLNGVTPGGWTDLARQLGDAGADALELNLYDIATLDETSADIEARQLEVVAAVVAAAAVPVSVKLSPFYAGLPSFVTRLADAGAAGVVVFNRFYQPDIDLDTLDVDRHLNLSTPAELPLRLHTLALLHGRVELSLASTGGVHSGLDAAKAILCGASAVQVVSALLADDAPSALERIHRELSGWLDDKGYRSVSEARGATALDNVADPHAWERVNYARILQGWQPPRAGR